jgi:hypothetical protein
MLQLSARTMKHASLKSAVRSTALVVATAAAAALAVAAGCSKDSEAAAAVASVEFLGGDAGKSTFSKAAGDFRQEGEKAGVMSVRFKPTAKGSVAIAGTFKMSVCSAKDCQIEVQEISVPVAVK